MYLTITKKNLIVLLGVVGVLALSSFSTTIFIKQDRMFLPIHLSQRPQPLNVIYGNGLDNPMGVAVGSGGRLYVSDPESHQIKLFQTDGTPIGAFGKSGTGKGQLNYPYGLAINSAGKLLVADPANRRVSVFSTDGKFIKELVPADNTMGLRRPGALTVNGNLIYISDLWGHQVVVVDNQGKLVRKIGSPGSKDGELKYPQSVVVDKKHRVWVADTGNNRIQVFSREGKFLFGISGKDNQLNLSLLRGMAADSLERILVADAISSKILVFDSSGKRLFSFGGLGSEAQQFKYPMGLWIAKDGRIYIADRGNHKVQVWGYEGR